MNICVVGLGKIGLPLGVQYASRGHRVIGADANPTTVEQVNAANEPFPGEAHLAKKLVVVVAAGLFTATTETSEAVSQSEAVVLVVALFVGEEVRPDFGCMDSATRDVAAGLQAGTLASYETTFPVGTTRARYGSMLEEGSGFEVGRDFHLVFSPERVLTGRVIADLRRHPKLVDGMDDASEKAGQAFYETDIEFDERTDLGRPKGVWAMGSAEAAEMATLTETNHRDVNVGLANQFAKYADKAGIDFDKVIQACNSQPCSRIHQPGIAVVGHCIPVCPRLYSHEDPDAAIVAATRGANASLPEYAVQRLEEAYGDLAGAKVALLGASYRGGVREIAFSGVFPVVATLQGRGARVAVHDPMYTDEELAAFGWGPHHHGEFVDAATIQADHRVYRELTLDAVLGTRVLLDGRNLLESGEPGLSQVGVGRGTAVSGG